jgi:spore coat polysaccharide biosynthesis protein SpsF
MDVEVFATKLLEVADREGLTDPDREHVSWFFVRNPDRFRLLMLPAPPKLNWPDLRLTVDEIDDFKLIDEIFEGLYPVKPHFSCEDIIDYLNNNRELLKINQHVHQKTL